jgi:mannan endo-1,4-beta-mannosidase
VSSGAAPFPMISRRLAWSLLAMVIVLIAVAVSATARPGTGSTADDFVKTDGISFTLAGKPFRFVGFNLYDAAAAGESFYSCVRPQTTPYTAKQLDSALAYMHHEAGATVLRFWAYQTYTRSGTDWSGINEVLALARKNDMRVIPVLEDGPGYCTTGPKGQPKYEVDGDAWYETGYMRPYGDAALSYEAYVQAIVSHYRNDPTIFGWEMMNEATTPARVDGQSAIVAFARDIGTIIHADDPNHLVTVGTESDGYPGASGPDYTAVYGLPQINFGVAHDYAAPGQSTGYDHNAMNGLTAAGNLPSPSDPSCLPTDGAPLACSVARNVLLDKPMILDEVAVSALSSSRTQLAARAQLFNRKLAAGFAHGVSGELVWDFNKIDVTTAGNYDVEQFDHDPLIPVMKRWAEQVSASPATRPVLRP